MLHFSDKPYRYFPPKPNRFAMRLFSECNRRWVLPGRRHRIKAVEPSNPEVVHEALRTRTTRRVLFIINHSTHSDPEITVEMHRRLGVRSLFMAAYDVFLRHPVAAWVMQRGGAFSVDRDVADKQAMAQAIKTLHDGHYALTIFPQGNVYLMNDKIALFLEGAAYFALQAQAALSDEAPDAEEILAIPVSFKTTHMTDQRKTLRAMIAQISATTGVPVTWDGDLAQELKRIGTQLLARHLRQRGYDLPGAEGKELPDILEQGAEIIIQGIEKKMDMKARARDSLLDRLRRIRRSIHRIRTDPDKEPDHAVAASWADEAILAMRVLAYVQVYLAENPTLDRVGERVESVMEDLYSRATPPYGDRCVRIRFGDPIGLTQYVETFKRKARRATTTLTQTWEDAVQEGIDWLNQHNRYPGGEPFFQ